VLTLVKANERRKPGDSAACRIPEDRLLLIRSVACRSGWDLPGRLGKSTIRHEGPGESSVPRSLKMESELSLLQDEILRFAVAVIA
jgi:hypothetical protein